jgi:hypothetical protein
MGGATRVVGPRDISHLASDTPQTVDMRTYVASGPHQLFLASAEGRFASVWMLCSRAVVVVVASCKQQRIINNSDICLIYTVKFPQLIATIPPNYHLPCNKMVGSDRARCIRHSDIVCIDPRKELRVLSAPDNARCPHVRVEYQASRGLPHALPHVCSINRAHPHIPCLVPVMLHA